VQYTPGWDCHGLPIELKAVGEGAGKTMSALEIRRVSRQLATSTIASQMDEFRSYGVMGDWDRRWTTMDLDYEIRQLRLFQKLVRRGLIYRKYKPVYWSPSSRTALAEAELEYDDDHQSTAAFVKFPITTPLPGERAAGLPLHAVIWTTTPWTLPANKAIAVHKDLDYAVVKVGDEALLISARLLDTVSTTLPELGDAAPELLIPSIKGAELLGLRYVNPLRGSRATAQPVIHADFVTSESGSGLVHCAPGHGMEDYEVCTPLGIGVSAPVDGDGCFVEDAYPDEPRRLQGLQVQGEGNSAVLALLGNKVLRVHKYRHKYPYDWRTKQPIIVRATAQWFADVAGIKDRALAALEDVRFVPESGKNRLASFVKARSEWCISRQRAWGVPIPALYDQDGRAVMTDESVEHIISVVRERGTDAWWADSPDEPAWIPESLRGTGDYRRGADTMDVWFDSGSSWTRSGRRADVYLEGTDQHRGWFQSSLLMHVAAADGVDEAAAAAAAPFKTLITHGFTLDANGKKMSKSLGNIISPDQVMDGTLLPPIKGKRKGGAKASPPAAAHDSLGPDALRLWACSGDYTSDVVIGEPVLKAVHSALLKYRSIIKMLLGSMHESAQSAALTALDHMAILRLQDTMDEVGRAYDGLEFNKAAACLNNWVVNDLSAFYLEALKDRLYCADGGGVLEPLFAGFLRMLAPVAPLLVEEAWDHAPAWLRDRPGAVHPLRQLYRSPVVDAARLTRDEAQLRLAIPAVMAAHAAIKAASEAARTDKVLGSSLQCSVRLDIPDEAAMRPLRALADELEAMFVVSSVELMGGAAAAAPSSSPPPPSEDVAWKYAQEFELHGVRCTAWVLPPTLEKCPRCWRYVATKEESLCQRCEEHVAGM